jgi:hypothetical protein
MIMLAERNTGIEDDDVPPWDALVGGDTHRDTRPLVILSAVGTVIAVISIDNDAAGYAKALAWIAEHAPGPRLLIGLEGNTRMLAMSINSAGYP